MFAIIESGGKQYQVAEGDTFRVELLHNCEAEQEIEIDKVLAIYDGEMLTAGQPYVENAKVTCKVIAHGKAKKVVVFHYKPKKNIRKKNGHRQPFTKLQVLSIQS
ncbi:MAG: 50S ribosomal protein L21 [Clostridiales bacterium]